MTALPLQLDFEEARKHLGTLLREPTRVLLLSPSGSGKTTLARQVLERYNPYAPSTQLLSNAQHHVELARQISGSTSVILDNIDLYTPADSANEVCAGLRFALESYEGHVIGTACRAIDSSVNILFQHTISLRPPSPEDRYRAFTDRFGKRGQDLAEATPGASWADLNKVAVAMEYGLQLEPLYTRPLPGTAENLYGLDVTVSEVEAVLDASFPPVHLRNNETCSKLLRVLRRIRTVGGVLLHGQPGVGKTALLRHAQRYVKDRVNVVHVSLPDIMHSRVGDSERALNALFAHARSISPCMLFIENIELLSASREEESGLGNRLLGTLLVEMDGIGSGGVLVVASARSLDGVDKALLRPGRFDIVLEVHSPDSNGRWSLWCAWCKRLSLPRGDRDIFETKSQSWTGGDIIAHAKMEWRERVYLKMLTSTG